MTIIRPILAFLISLTLFPVHADIYYGTLRGVNLLELKSPYNGVVNLIQSKNEGFYFNESPFKIESYELESKKKILQLKINNLKSRISRLERDYEDTKKSFSLGYVSRSEMDVKEDTFKEATINLQELHLELNALESTLELGHPVINTKFIIRDIYAMDNQVVNTGDAILRLENIDDFLIDIKYDPVTLTGRIQDKKILVKSLVTGTSYEAFASKVSSSGDNSFHGSKIASLMIKEHSEDLVNLLDSVFEVHIID
ncbi:hypothetical protein VC899_22840 [Citrobacter braakii]|uniref:hypothetical protein n=1 Tax=Citrobacter braakii TaxID=57706 RepID=UPI002B24DBFF|nr:hypothetical protein [Citrobacter braakii]MEB0968001.1 hypothetical protein [Citrobacter braakii]